METGTVRPRPDGPETDEAFCAAFIAHAKPGIRALICVLIIIIIIELMVGFSGDPRAVADEVSLFGSQPEHMHVTHCSEFTTFHSTIWNI